MSTDARAAAEFVEALARRHRRRISIDIPRQHYDRTPAGSSVELPPRRRTAPAAWSPPTGETAHQPEPARPIPDERDRRIRALTGAGRERGFYGHYDSQVETRYLLAERTSSWSCGRMCQSGRCFANLSDTEVDPTPLAWDDAPPWELWLSLAPTPAGNAERPASGPAPRRAANAARGRPARPRGPGHHQRYRRVDGLPGRVPVRPSPTCTATARSRWRCSRGTTCSPSCWRCRRCPSSTCRPTTCGTKRSRRRRPYLTIKRRDDRGWMSDRDQNWLIGDLSFEYDGHVVPAGPGGASSSPTSDGCCCATRRPSGLFAGQTRGGRLPPQDRLPPGRDPGAARRNLPKAGAGLLQEGWRVEAEGKLYRQAGDFRIEVTSGIDWFELHGGVDFGDQEVAAARPARGPATRRGRSCRWATAASACCRRSG